MSDTFGDARPRGVVSAEALRRAGRHIDAARPALATQSDLGFLETHGGSAVTQDAADLFFAEVTAVVTSTRYGFMEQVLDSDGNFQDAGEPRNCDGVLNWAYPQAGDSYTTGDVVLMRRSSYNPDLFEIVATGSAGGWFWAEVTGSSGGEPNTTYSWKKKVLSPSTHLFVDASPSVTGTNTLKRAPTNTLGTLPVIPTGQVVLARASPTDPGYYECPAPGGRQAVTYVESVTCSGGTLTVVSKTLHGRDLSIV